MSDAATRSERLRWIETWAVGWQRSVGGTSKYHEMPLDVASAMVLELLGLLRDPAVALDLIADVLHESGQEVGEIIERLRWERSANAAEARA